MSPARQQNPSTAAKPSATRAERDALDLFDRHAWDDGEPWCDDATDEELALVAFEARHGRLDPRSEN